MFQLQRQLDETRSQLALAHQLAEGKAHTAAVQAAADLQIQQLRDERDELARAGRGSGSPQPVAIRVVTGAPKMAPGAGRIFDF